MAILTTQATAATVNTLISRVRNAIGDTQSATSGQKFSSAQILERIDDTIAMMWNKLYEDGGPMLASSNLTYTADAYSTNLPAGLNMSSIYKIEDIDNPSTPIFIDYIDFLDLDRDDYQAGWTFVGDAIALRPKPKAAKALRIWYLRNYIPIAGSAAPSTDQHPMPANHEELIVIGAALRLQTNDDGAPPRREKEHEDLKRDFEAYAIRFRGPAYVRDTRLYG